jgi:lysophospholipase L1-like esterase
VRVGFSGSHYRQVQVPQPFTTRLAASPATIWLTGDSITRGNGHSSTYGFRKGLDDWITAQGYPTTFVGHINGPGDWADPYHSAIAGSKIADVSTFCTTQYATGVIGPVTLAAVLIGTNDCDTGPYDGTTTPAAYAALLNQIFAVGQATLLVSTVPASSTGATQTNVLDFNSKLPAIWDAFKAAHPGKIYRWNANTALGGPSYNGANFVDALHPNDTGYGLMASAITAALSLPPT